MQLLRNRTRYYFLFFRNEFGVLQSIWRPDSEKNHSETKLPNCYKVPQAIQIAEPNER